MVFFLFPVTRYLSFCSGLAFSKTNPHRVSWCLLLLIAGAGILDAEEGRRALPGVSSGAKLGVAGILHTQCRMMAGVYLARTPRGDSALLSALAPCLRLVTEWAAHRYLAEGREWRGREQRNWAVSAQGRVKSCLNPKCFQESEALTGYCSQGHRGLSGGNYRDRTISTNSTLAREGEACTLPWEWWWWWGSILPKCISSDYNEQFTFTQTLAAQALH